MSDRRPRTSESDSVKHKPDYQLLVCIGILVPFGLVMVYSSSFVEGFVYYDNGFHYMTRQLFAAVVGTVGLIVTQRIDYRTWRTYSLHLLAFAFLLLVLTGFVLPAEMTEVNNSRSWIRLGFFSVQPSEFVKLALIIYLASWLSRRAGKVANFNTGMLPFAAVVGIFTALVMVGRDLGSSTVMVSVAALVYFVAGASLWHFLGAGVLGGVFFLLAINVASYRLERINAWLDPFAYYSGAGFQPIHALYALASGGVFGLGIGQSRQKYLWLPQSYTDTILAIIGEELGLIGTLFVVGCFAFIAFRGFRIANSAPNAYAALLATGLTLWLVIQAVINLAVATTLVPFTGITLPFLSYGGTSLMMSMIAIGILLNVSKYTLVDTDQPPSLRTRYEHIRAAIAALLPFGRRDRGSRVPIPRSRRGTRERTE
jgi:cell division protein FtsW